MAQNSYFKTILSYFQTMDIAKLRLYLKDEYTYQDTTKEIFLNEIAAIFEANQNSGDTEIILYPGHCGAPNSLCDNCGKKGYRMVGNNSGNYIDLIFEIENDDIKDIYDCSLFVSNEEVKNLDNQTSIHINKDDKVTFAKTPEYWAKLNAANNAIDEIVTTPPSLINFEALSYWVDKNAIVNKRIGGDHIFGPTMRWTPFLRLFSELSEMRVFLKYHSALLTEAMSKVSSLNNEEDLINWLLKYEKAFEKAPFELVYGFKAENDYCILDNDNEIRFQGHEFLYAVKFFENYKEHYYPLLDKYTTYTDMERTEATNDWDSRQKGIDITSLRFHLDRRKAMEEIGITIPLYMTRADDPPF